MEAFLVAHGVPRAEAAGRTVTFLHCVDGLVFGRLVDDRGGSRELLPEVRALLAIALGEPGEG
ncbi:hypothetical protein [Streptomyces sp. PR69]|uniref:hypothetical protein n=1 Tax=Streptomyces sp. PR69 TaxID=2984950 RepID=UPI002264E0BD|nr:hypothetical protein [Streptomyces sp. PR69]